MVFPFDITAKHPILRQCFIALAAVLFLLPSIAFAEIHNVDRVKDDPAMLSLQIQSWVPDHAEDPDAVDPYFDSAGRVVRLSTVAGVSFRVAAYSENFDQDDYDEALERYTSVRDCLLKTERDKPRPNLAYFDWEGMPNHGAAYACFVLIFTSYDTAADVMWWMIKQGMRVRRSYAKYYVLDPRGHRKTSEDFGLVLNGWLLELPYGGSKNPWPLSAFEAKDYVLTPKFSKTGGLVKIDITAHRMK